MPRHSVNANCHPSIFDIRKKTTQHFSMRYILAGDSAAGAICASRSRSTTAGAAIPT